MFHTHGLFVAINTTLMAQASMHFLPKFDPDRVIDCMADSTVLMGVPTFYVRLLETPRLTRDACQRMRLFISGSAPLLADVHGEFHSRTGHKILERYGMTETNMNTSNPLAGPRIPGTVGPPLPGVEVRIVDAESGRAIPQGEIGMIELRGPNVFVGYWDRPEETDDGFREDGFFVTGDLGRIHADGYVEIVGRLKDLVISGGLNVYPAEIEAEVNQLDGIEESAVIGLADRDLGEAVTAVVVLDGSAAVTEDELLRQLRPRLAPYKVPKRIVIRGALPRNAMGKVEKNVLREELAALSDRPTKRS
jgi:malonyl-CoA/methylmalonyl-CoA synthetase